MAFYDRFESLCKDFGVTPTEVARENGITQQAVSLWKKRGSTPSATTVQKLAHYFDVSIEYLLGAKSSVPEYYSQNQKESEEHPDNLSNARQRELVVLARRAEQIPDEDYKRIVKTFEDTIDIYLRARGLDPDDYR